MKKALLILTICVSAPFGVLIASLCSSGSDSSKKVESKKPTEQECEDIEFDVSLENEGYVVH